ncbi:Short-chain dehydrogenase/reductase aba4 [Coniosporium uncinatum]|uniref:Short-chain dehydrogenase/reductase aba4 n=1 Tax=Coniosporium uncinatum TaxID=93489 RepID=A0ACC3DCP5_9PEZI|nr:Short-chain dehydrogenase/reductase aba4 [Coniosporium uncinatum]
MVSVGTIASVGVSMSKQQFKGKVIALTGAASGIALTTAHILASRGATLSLGDIQEGPLNEAASAIRLKHGVDVSTCVLDVRKTERVDAWIAQTLEKYGKLDGAANLAGVLPRSLVTKGLVEQDDSEWDFVIGVNLTGLMHCLRAQMRVISDNGSIVNAASIAGVQGRPRLASYSASKHGVIGLTRSAAKEIGIRGVRVNAVCP